MSRNANRNDLVPRGTAAAAITGTVTHTGAVTVTVGVTVTGTAAAAIPCCLICKQHGTTTMTVTVSSTVSSTVTVNGSGLVTTAGYHWRTLPPRRGKKITAQQRGTSAALGTVPQIVVSLSPSEGERVRVRGPNIPNHQSTTTTLNGIIPRAVHSTKWDTLNSNFFPQCGSTVEPHYNRKTVSQFELVSTSPH